MKTQNPWLEIWTSPKRTIRPILGKDPQRNILSLAIIWGVISGLSWIGYLWNTPPNRETVHKTWVWIAILIGGGLSGLVYLYLGGWLFKITGSWLGGMGSYTDVKCAVGWSFYPAIISHITSNISLWSAPNPWIQGIFALLTIVFGVWAFIILLNTVGEAHHFSAWKALLAYIIILVLIFVAVLVISLLIPLLAPLF